MIMCQTLKVTENCIVVKTVYLDKQKFPNNRKMYMLAETFIVQILSPLV